MTSPTGIAASNPEGQKQHSITRGFADRQADFARAILDPHTPIPPGLVGPDGQPSAKRFAVYRNNVVVGLIETLKAAYPVVRRLVGEEFFIAMARLYVMEQPPASPIMLDYGVGFSDFIAHFEPAGVLAYLPDVARLERAWVEAYHAPEASSLPASALAHVPPGDVPAVRLAFHPSVRVIRSVFPVVDIWQANVESGHSETIDLDAGGEDALVARPEAEVEIRRLPPGAALFIEALRAGLPIIEAMERALSVNPGFNLASALRGLIEAAVIVGYDVLPTQSVEAA